jgi:hypothetical protein
MSADGWRGDCAQPAIQKHGHWKAYEPEVDKKGIFHLIVSWFNCY